MASSVDAKLLKSTKFPQEFAQKVDMQKVNVEVMKKYESPVITHTKHKLADKCYTQVDRRQNFRDPGERGRRRDRAMLQLTRRFTLCWSPSPSNWYTNVLTSMVLA